MSNSDLVEIVYEVSVAKNDCERKLLAQNEVRQENDSPWWLYEWIGLSWVAVVEVGE